MNTPSPYISRNTVNTVRTRLAEYNWQRSDKIAYVERAAVIQLVIDWAQGRMEAPESVLAVIDDSHIGPGNSGYSLSTRINRILADLVRKTPEERTPHGTLNEVLYAPVTEKGLEALIVWLEAQPKREVPGHVAPADSTLDMHPRVRNALKVAGVTSAEDRAAVMAHSRFRQNISGGRSSDWIAAAADALRQAGSAEALRAQDRADNEALMARDSIYARNAR